MVLKRMEEGYRVSLWKAIKNGWEVVCNGRGFKVGNRQMVKFKKDR